MGFAKCLTGDLEFILSTHRIDKALRERQKREALFALRSTAQRTFGRLLGPSLALHELTIKLRQITALPEFTVLLQGESGSGKALIAHALHAESKRSSLPFLKVDCASSSESLLESELFGHEKGAFPFATAARQGLLEIAGQGTLFLDEIGELPLRVQAKLLRTLESGSFCRVGGRKTYSFAASVVSATHRCLETEIAAGRFREDLYFRLNVVPLRVPPLRERKEDVPELATLFLQRAMRKTGRYLEGFSKDALLQMQDYAWPGNVRELKNLIERWVVLLPHGALILPEHLPRQMQATLAAPDALADGRSLVHVAEKGEGAFLFRLPEQGCDLEQVEKEFVLQAMQRTLGQRSAAAKLLGMSRHTLRYRLQKYGLAEQDFAKKK